MNIIYGIGIVLIVLFLIDSVNKARLRSARESGVLPPADQETDSDVERLLARGKKIMAIKVYREIHNLGLKEAKEAVEELQKELQSR